MPTRFPGPVQAVPELAKLRQAASAAGFTRDALTRAGVLSAPGQVVPPEIIRQQLAASPSLDVFARLFIMGEALDRVAVARAIEHGLVGKLEELGVLVAAGEGIRSTICLAPVADRLIASDFSPVQGGPVPGPDHVLVPGMLSQLLGDLTVRKPIDLAIDVGTGQGYQAILAAGHAKRVIATDIVPRALNLADAGLAINGITNVELRQGSLLEPLADVQGQADLVVCNPPFVLTPRPMLSAVTSEREGDSLFEELVRGSSTLLRDGGYAVMMGAWYEQPGGEWSSRPRGWIQGCDAWLLRFSSQSPAEYARDQSLGQTAVEGRTPPTPQEWEAYFKNLNATMIHLGVVILRKRAGKNWLRAETINVNQRTGSHSDQIQRTFAATTLLADLAQPAALLDYRLIANPDSAVDQSLRLQGGRWVPAVQRLRQTTGFAMMVDVEADAWMSLAAFDGQRTVRSALHEISKAFKIDQSQTESRMLPAVRKLLEIGYLSPTIKQ